MKNTIFLIILILFSSNIVNADDSFFDDIYKVKDIKKKELNEKIVTEKKKNIVTEKKKNIVAEKIRNIVAEKKNFILIKNTRIKMYSLKEAKKEIKKNNKPIFLIIYSTDCKYCKKYFSLLTKKSWFTRYLKENFNVAYLNIKETINYPELQTSVAPTTFILNKHNNLIIKPIKGIPEINSYLRSLLYGVGTSKEN